MNTFKHLLNLNCCPSCGAKVRSASIQGTHSNGQQREVVVFDCWSEIEHSPNFSQQIIRKPCPKSVKEKQKNETRRAILLKIQNLVIDSNDPEFEAEFNRFNEYFLRNYKIDVHIGNNV